MIRLLVITRAPWLDDNALGRTLSALFSELPETKIYSISLRESPKTTSLSVKNYYISEKQIINHLLRKGKVGAISPQSLSDIECEKEQKSEMELYQKSKKYKLTGLKFVREFLWGIGKWKNAEFDEFLAEASPDIIFFPDFPCIYAHKVLKYAVKNTGAKVAIFHTDDCYTLKMFSLNPVTWLYRFYQRKWVRKSVNTAKLHYVISDVQKEDYDKAFGVNNKILTKFGDFSANPDLKTEFNEPLQLVYTGNIWLERWKSLKLIADALKMLNKDGTKAQLRIYTANSVDEKIEKALNVSPHSFIMGKASPDDIPAIQSDADMLVHVESFEHKSMLDVRQSFSTKIVDYLQRGRAIVAIGPSNVASIKHFIDNDCALYGDSVESIYNEFEKIIKDKNLLNDYASRAYYCGRQYHNKDDMISMLYNDFNQLCQDG